MGEKRYYVYMMTNQGSTVLYTGMTNDLCRRVWEHKEKRGSVFTKRYNATRLVYYELHHTAGSAFEREQKIKDWEQAWKNNLIMKFNPQWLDLYDTLVPDD
jgi:putative endonuclease